MRNETVPVGEDAAEVSFSEQQGRILPDLTIGAELDSAKALKANENLANRGVSLFGAGFIVSREKALELGLGTVHDLEKHIRPYRNGRDLTDKSRGAFVIDFYGLKENEVLAKYPAAYQHLLENVKPERDHNNRASRREKWWLFGETNPKLREMLFGLSKYIVTVETAKHRIFQFLDTEILPDNKLVAIALDDAYFLGILSSRIHLVWATGTGSTLEDRPVYVKSKGFDPFPFPNPTEAQRDRIRDLAEQLDAHRKRQQAQHPALTLTDLYNVVEKLRAGEPLNPKDQQTHQQGLASVVLSLHQQLDAAVADAYGWPADLPDAELLARLVRLNHDRAREEEAGHVRYLRPAYQAPGQQQLGLGLADAGPVGPESVTSAAGPQPWPRQLAQQMQAVREAVRSAGQPLTAAQVAGRFEKTRAATVQPLLDTLADLALLRVTEAGAYAA